MRGRQADAAPTSTVLPTSTLAVLQALPMDWLVVSSGFRIDAESEGLALLGVTESGRLTDSTLRSEITQAVRTMQVRELEFDVGANKSVAQRVARVRVCPLDARQAVVLIEDVTHPLRVDAMRRDFIVNVSHELKTPVGALLLLAEAAKSSLDEPVTLERFINRMQTEAERMSRLINDLTDLSRLQAANPDAHRTDIPVHRLFAEALDSVRLIAERNEVELLSANTGTLVVTGDEEQLVTALRNLLLNAITYSPNRTRVTLTANVAADHVDLVVSDQGIGIPESEQSRIFERFYRVDPARSRETGGTGLGLAIVKHIAAAHGGDCLVWSKPNEGSTFTLRLRHGHRGATGSSSQARD